MQSLSEDLLRMILILVPQGDRCQFTTKLLQCEAAAWHRHGGLHDKA